MNTQAQQHTPGPWAVNPLKLDQICTADGSQCIAEANRNVANAQQVIADARLIAAAPDLLAALEEALPLLLDHYAEQQIEVGKVRDAIAKARG